MDKYYVVRHQNGGCDYTIGCGIAIELICNVASLEEAKQTVIDDYYNSVRLPSEGRREYQISDCYILVVSDTVEMMSSLVSAKQAAHDEKMAEQDRKKEEAERKQYESLKKKFEK